MVLAVVRQMAAHRAYAAARHRARVHRRRGGRQRLRRALPGGASTATSSTACTEAIGEVGGFSYTVDDDQRLYLIETAEKGIDWLRLHAKGRPGHGSMIHDDNAVTALAEAVARVGRHRFPVVVTADRAGVPRPRSPTLLGIELDPDDPETAIAKLGPIANDHRRDHPQHRQPDPARAPATRTT